MYAAVPLPAASHMAATYTSAQHPARKIRMTWGRLGLSDVGGGLISR